jgi:ABC-type transporter Mla subunit MlaD
MPDMTPLDPTSLSGVITSVIAGLTGAGGVGAALRGKGGLSDEDRALLQGLGGQLKALRGQVATLTADVAAMREEGGADRGRAEDTLAEIRQLAEDARPVLRGWERDQERARTLEESAGARGRRLEEVERQVGALHGRLDALTQQLREQLPPGLTQAISSVASAAHALRHALEDRIPRRDS